MKMTKLLLATIILAGATSLVQAQHGGHSGAGVGQVGQDPRFRSQILVPATEGQRGHLRTCSVAAERLRTQVGEFRKSVDSTRFDLATSRQQWDQVRGTVAAMQSDHTFFLESLSADQQAALKSRLHKMDQLSSDLSSRMETMDRDLERDTPNAKGVADRAKEVEKAIKKWQKQHREIGSDMGIEG